MFAKIYNSKLFQKVFCNKNGRVVIGQKPNLPLIIWLVTIALGVIFKTGSFHSALSLVGLIALIIWASLELFQGVNYFRRFLGLVILVYSILSRML